MLVDKYYLAPPLCNGLIKFQGVPRITTLDREVIRVNSHPFGRESCELIQVCRHENATEVLELGLLEARISAPFFCSFPSSAGLRSIYSFLHCNCSPFVTIIDQPNREPGNLRSVR